MVRAFVTRAELASANQTEKSAKITRRPTNVSLPSDLLERAKELNVNVSRASERGLREEVQEIEAREWAEQNAELVKAYTAMVEREGLPLAKYRTF
ncbi:type II toxin-antitoxin system CcdA family antitoxin [Caballeronia cordobensis]|uniref:type II toxin-antitoxin system CcdA family antitoxin n=1 Tax=Caballeronia cordobensis TaxID=1353886 RepID=UPI00045F094C|nr:post-segregation antitoxin CcdA [Burkholderia sp. KK1]BAO89766.1 Post-segregation antitoxin CcdA [Burkholderia sp. RPE67]